MLLLRSGVQASKAPSGKHIYNVRESASRNASLNYRTSERLSIVQERDDAYVYPYSIAVSLFFRKQKCRTAGGESRLFALDRDAKTGQLVS